MFGNIYAYIKIFKHKINSSLLSVFFEMLQIYLPMFVYLFLVINMRISCTTYFSEILQKSSTSEKRICND